MAGNLKPTILVADSELCVFHSVARALLWPDNACELLWARTGVEACRATRVLRPELVLIAPNLPVIDGARVVRAFTRSGAHRDLRFLALVRRDDEPAARRMLAAGARGVVFTPFGAGELRRRVSDALAAPPVPLDAVRSGARRPRTIETSYDSSGG